MIVIGRVGRRDTCDHCGADLHCCLSCRHHDFFAQNQCREPGTEQVRDRSAANFCDFFDLGSGRAAEEDPAAAAKAKLEALFRK
ncbi:hypothetical protein AKJ08_1464 [Vulgatibacter incomptus]|uniref:Uncharacterized protein n=1 Tax=Vulgatibacter incomptus TaxID=1391653 RepID=A0A0K1PC46_9BACT|nr:hypothetical protein AKJ08_1464 [Vulgatibacter incomptus]